MLAQAPPRKYRIERYLTEGGMGAIYLGKKLGAGGFEKEVVLKQLLPEFTSRPEFRDLFFREAKISATLDHSNIVRTFDLVSSDDSLFIVMEYVRGADLRTIAWRARLKRRALSPQAVLHVALEILAGLAYAHSRRSDKGAALGIIHRDVSPSNILCSGQGDVKLSDFGIAKATTFSSVFYRVRGKVGYMSPEQAKNQPLDGRSDLFSLAVCLFETLTGERLYSGDLQTPPELIYGQKIPPLSLKRPDLPLELEDVLAKALSRAPEDRFQDAATFAEALRDVARRHGLAYSAPELAAELTELLGPNPESWSQDDSVGFETEKLPLGRGLEGREAEAVGLGEGAVPESALADNSTMPLAAARAARMGQGDVDVDRPRAGGSRPSPPAPARAVTPPRPRPAAGRAAETRERAVARPRTSPAAGVSLAGVRPADLLTGVDGARYRTLWWTASILVLGVGIAVGAVWARSRPAPRAVGPRGNLIEAARTPSPPAR
jgi:serine/threonine-protein kinase